MEQETREILQKLRQARLARKMSLLKLANEVEISHSHLYYIESLKVVPSLDVVVRLAKALGVTAAELLSASPAAPPEPQPAQPPPGLPQAEEACVKISQEI
jgi:transcriptional regulator with XRE-family HTH domain